MAAFAERGGWWVVAQVGFFGGVAAAALWAPRFEAPPWLVIAGSVIAVAGIVLAGDALIRIRRHLTPYPAPVDGAPLQHAGAFRLVRHPIYGGIVLVVAGLGVSSGNLAVVISGLALGGFFHLKSQHEERLIVAAHPDYEQYRHRVRHRLVPGLW